MSTSQYDTQKLDHAYEVATDMCQVIGSVENIVDGDIVQFDQRIQDYYSSQFQTIKSIDLVDDVNKTNDFASWLSEKIAKLKETIRKTTGSDIGADTGGGSGGSGGGGGGYIPPVVDPLSPETTTGFLEGLPDEAIDDIKERLRALGYTDEEIEKIIHGEMPVHELTYYELLDALAGLGEGGKDFYKKLSDLVGYNILNEDGTINKDLFKVAMLMAEKGLGMKIDMSSGSEFRNYITNIATQLEDLYKKDPSVRDKIKEKYGIDIFNEDGTVDLEKLALIKILDGMNVTDDYDLEKMFGLTVPTTTPIAPTDAPTNPPEDPIPTVPPGPTSAPTNPPTGAPTNPPTGAPPSPPTSAPGPYDPTPTSPQTGVSHGGSIATEEKDGLLDAAAAANAGLGKGMLKALENGAGILSKKLDGLKPTIGTAKIIKTKGANVGVIAAASLVAGGAAAGGGVMLGKKFKLITFTPDNWNGLDYDTQETIISLMKNVGFNDEEIEKLKTSTFKIPSEELKEHTTKISELVKDSDESIDSLTAQYGYQIADDSGNVNEYLLFITMIIDGKGYDDNYNIYNVININIGEDEDADFSYNGISMEDYIAEDTTKDEENEEDSEDLSFDSYTETESKEESLDTSVAKSAALAIKNMSEAGFSNNGLASSSDDSSFNDF